MPTRGPPLCTPPPANKSPTPLPPPKKKTTDRAHRQHQRFASASAPPPLFLPLPTPATSPQAFSVPRQASSTHTSPKRRTGGRHNPRHEKSLRGKGKGSLRGFNRGVELGNERPQRCQKRQTADTRRRRSSYMALRPAIPTTNAHHREADTAATSVKICAEKQNQHRDRSMPLNPFFLFRSFFCPLLSGLLGAPERHLDLT